MALCWPWVPLGSARLSLHADTLRGRTVTAEPSRFWQTRQAGPFTRVPVWPAAVAFGRLLWVNSKNQKWSAHRAACSSGTRSQGYLTSRPVACASLQQADGGYRQPADDLVSLVDAPSTPSISVDPSERWLLIMENPPLRTLADLCREERKLAGLRFEPSRLLPALAGGYTRLQLRPLFGKDGLPLSVDQTPHVQVEGLPKGARVRSVSWRPGGKGFAFVLLPDEAAESQLPELWHVPFDSAALADEALNTPSTTVRAERLLDKGGNPLRLNSIQGSPFQWHPDGQRLLLRTVPSAQTSREPGTVNTAAGAVRLPAGPAIQVSEPGQKAPVVTYQDLLKTPEDEDDYERFTTTQILIYDMEARQATKFGPPDMYRATIISPDGQFLLVSMTRRPFSYLVPDGRFAKHIEVWPLPEPGAAMEEPTERWRIADQPVRDQIATPRDAVEDCPRGFTWQPHEPHQLRWVQALDGGDPRNEPTAEGIRDRLYMLNGPPFNAEDKIAGPGLEMRYSGSSTCHDGTQILSEWRWKDRRLRTWVLPKDAAAEDVKADRWVLYDRSFEDIYGDPGSFQTKLDDVTRKHFLRQRTDGALILFGSGANPRGRRPFVDVLRLEETVQDPESSGTPLAGARRIWRCVAAPSRPGDPPEEPLHEVAGVLAPEDARREELERPAVLLGGSDGEPLRLLFWREAQDTPPNLFSCSLDSVEGEKEVQITDFPHPQPALRSVSRQLVKYRRADGVELNANLYLPPGYDAERDGRLPCLMWAYPREFKSADSAGQVSSSPYAFVRGSWARPLFWILRGYAVFDDPKMPVVGEGDTEPNDTFVEQLQMNAQAAVDCVVKELGIADPDRICVGGHSYGAFMTAHLLAHTDLFRAGICRSGAYNRSLTPFGFQCEDRTYWEATETYTKMSPFLYAKALAEKGAPLLFVHGDEDPNPGTYKMQSERFFQALKGHGATAKLVVLPRERHGYAARESILHTLYEQDRWLEVHNAPRSANAESESDPSGQSA